MDISDAKTRLTNMLLACCDARWVCECLCVCVKLCLQLPELLLTNMDIEELFSVDIWIRKKYIIQTGYLFYIRFFPNFVLKEKIDQQVRE